MKDADLVIHAGHIVKSTRITSGSIVIKNGKIIAVTDKPYSGSAHEVINEPELAALPGLIDPHTHMRDPGLTKAEDWSTGTAAAAAGGVTTVLEHPNTIPSTSTLEGFNYKKEIASAKAIVDFGLIAGAGSENIDDIPALAKAGAVAYKTFMLPSTGPNLIGCTATNDGVLYDLFTAVSHTRRPHNVHAESYPLISHFEQFFAEQGRCAPTDHTQTRPVLTEVEAFVRAMTLAGPTGVRLNFVHASSGSAVDRVMLFQDAGLVNVTIETCPHYLLLTSDRMETIGPYAKVNPPLRSEEERERLWNHLKAGRINTIGSDHAPHPRDAIERGWKDITASPGGSPGLAQMLPILLTQVDKGHIDLSTLTRLTSENVARLYDLYPGKGTLNVGADADIVLVDLKARNVVVPIHPHTKDPRIARMWEGYSTVGSPVMTIVRGHIVMRNGEVIGQPGYGKFIAPSNLQESRTL